MNILVLTTSDFPIGDANAIRQYNFASVLARRGHQVTILSLNRPNSNGKKNYNGIYHNAIKGGYFDVKKQLKEYLSKNSNPDVLFINSIPLPAFKYVKKYAIKNNIKLIHDAVEWHSIDQYKLFEFYRLFAIHHRTNMINKYVVDRKFSVIAISEYLCRHFEEKKIDTIKIPIIMDTNKITFSKVEKDSKLRLLYAGSPAGKDYLDNIIAGIDQLKEHEKDRIEFDIYGINQDELSLLLNESISNLKEKKYLKIHGKVSHDDILDQLNRVDFTILIRSSVARYAKAGFPTKVVESLVTGTPIILNFTSDLSKYLTDGYDCIKVDTENASDIVNALRKALSLSDNEKNEMSLNARKTSEKYFSIDKYEESIIRFFEK